MKRLADIKDPAHTPIFSEVTPQPDGKMLVAYADGHVGEVMGDEVKALEKLDRAQHDAVTEITLYPGCTMTVPRELAAGCQRLIEQYHRTLGSDDPAAYDEKAAAAVRAAVLERINEWKKSRGLPTNNSKNPASLWFKTALVATISASASDGP